MQETAYDMRISDSSSDVFSSDLPEEALSLGLSPGSLVYRFHPIRYADDTSMALEYATIPAYCLPSVDTVGASLYEALEAAGHLPVRALQRLRAIAATARSAERWVGNECGSKCGSRGSRVH